jgi:glycogen synthase
MTLLPYIHTVYHLLPSCLPACLQKKRDGKAALQAAVNLPPEEDRPVVGFIGRLVSG